MCLRKPLSHSWTLPSFCGFSDSVRRTPPKPSAGRRRSSFVIVYRVSSDQQSKQAVDRRRIKPVERLAATERRKSFLEWSRLGGVDPSGLVRWFVQDRSSLPRDSRFH